MSKKISALTQKTTVVDADLFVLVDSAVATDKTKKVLASAIKTYIGSGHTIQNSGTSLTARANLNFTGGLKATDDAGNDQSDVELDLTSVNAFTGQQYFAIATLTDAATISWNMNTQQVAKITLGGNRTMAAPTNIKAGGIYWVTVIQDATGSRTLTWNAVFKWAGGSAPTLTTTANGIDVFQFISQDGTNLLGAGQFNFS